MLSIPLSAWVYVLGILAIIVGAGAFFGAPYVPTKRRDVRRMFDELYPLTTDDVVLDIGSGDGLVLREVSRRGARGVGYEINPVFYGLSRVLSRGDRRVKVVLANAWRTPFPDDTTMVYIFSVAKDSRRLIQKLQKETDRLGRPLNLVCYGNALPGLAPVRTFEAYFLYTFQPAAPLHLTKA